MRLPRLSKMLDSLILRDFPLAQDSRITTLPSKNMDRRKKKYLTPIDNPSLDKSQNKEHNKLTCQHMPNSLIRPCDNSHSQHTTHPVAPTTPGFHPRVGGRKLIQPTNKTLSLYLALRPRPPTHTSPSHTHHTPHPHSLFSIDGLLLINVSTGARPHAAPRPSWLMHSSSILILLARYGPWGTYSK